MKDKKETSGRVGRAARSTPDPRFETEKLSFPTEEKDVREKASALLEKHPEYERTIIVNYGKNVVQMLEEGGSIDFGPDGLKEVVHGEKLTYNDYIDAQINAIEKTHDGFQWCFYNFSLGFKGQVEKVNEKHICFQRIYIDGMYNDGCCAEYKEQHVWMDLEGFEGLKPGDCVEFFAEPYRYLKRGKGKQIDYAIRNPQDVEIIENYQLPSNDDIIRQEADLLLCETCYLSEYCNRDYCIRNSKKRKKTENRAKKQAQEGR